MPPIDVRLLEGVFSEPEQDWLAEGLTNAVVAVKGESLRAETEALISEVPVGGRYDGGVKALPEGVGK